VILLPIGVKHDHLRCYKAPQSGPLATHLDLIHHRVLSQERDTSQDLLSREISQFLKAAQGFV
jgi:hypothetical protein